MTDSPTKTTTQEALIAAGLRLFGKNGFTATSTRALADAAGTNVASISYHFGSKEGLRTACAETIASRIGGLFAQAGDAPLPSTPEAAMAEIDASIHAFAGMVLASPRADFIAFIMRELSDPGEVADQLFEAVFLPRHARFCALWSVITGAPAEDDEVKLLVFATIGQVLYFRIAQTFVTRRMGWDAIGADEARQIADIVISTLRARAERITP